ncbi:helix-turn-helix domain-containing protein [Bordetella bronchialis]|uniref:helix-turn-helix domain-containing protein n=1 Tax=Bordetella bronchialis TaxID=463025 RepID=UPI000AEBD7F5|nr:helix-turn-helix domain-containing protein [Bordetella bronchialis]
MSIALMTEAWKLQGLSSTQKLVLLSLADNANDQGECYPSIATIVHRTCLSERAVQSAVRSLRDLGYVKSMARLGTSTVYLLTIAGAGGGDSGGGNAGGAAAAANSRNRRTPARNAPPAPSAPPAADAPPAFGAPPAGRAPPQDVHPAPAADAPPPPQQVHPGGAAGAPKPSVNRQLNRQVTVKGAGAPAVELPEWLAPDVWALFDRFRKRKDGKAWTEDAQRLTVRDLGKLREQGFDPVLVVEQSVQRGWTGVFPLRGEFLDRQKQQQSGAHKHGNFDQQDYRAGIGEDGRF